MIINTHYKFIFIHVPKTAGKSITDCLETLRGNRKSWINPDSPLHETIAELETNIDSRFSPIDKIFRDTDISSYYTFGFVRNPWDRMSSLYRFLKEKRYPPTDMDGIDSLKELLVEIEEGNVGWIQKLYSLRQQSDFFRCTDGSIKIDFLGHFEYLNEDMENISRNLGIPFQLKHINSSSNTGVDYRKFYDDEMIELVANRYSDDIEIFGYNFDSKYPENRISGKLDIG